MKEKRSKERTKDGWTYKCNVRKRCKERKEGIRQKGGSNERRKEGLCNEGEK